MGLSVGFWDHRPQILEYSNAPSEWPGIHFSTTAYLYKKCLNATSIFFPITKKDIASLSIYIKRTRYFNSTIESIASL